MKPLAPQSNLTAAYVEGHVFMEAKAPPLTAEIADLKRQAHVLLYLSGVNLIFNFLTIFIAVMVAA